MTETGFMTVETGVGAGSETRSVIASGMASVTGMGCMIEAETEIVKTDVGSVSMTGTRVLSVTVTGTAVSMGSETVTGTGAGTGSETMTGTGAGTRM